MLVPKTPLGSLLVGSIGLFGPTPIETRVLMSRDEVGAWLGDPGFLPSFDATIERIVPMLGATRGVLRALRQLLAEDPGVRADAAARTLALSERSLRRARAAIGTSFRSEQIRARAGHGLRALGAPSKARPILQ